MVKNVVIAGLGLIGGSLAMAFRQADANCTVAGFDLNPDVLRAALECGAIRKAGTEEDLRTADILYLCLYPRAAVEFLKTHAASIGSGCIVTDTCGIKGQICPELTRLAAQHGFSYVGSHPMAGKEKNGFANGDADLFRGASYILVPCGAPQKAVDTLADTALRLGFGGTIITTPEEHDRMIAFTSQLPHVLACAYVKSPCCPKHKGFSAGSYRDVSRVASINETLWAELFLENREALVEELDLLCGHIKEIREAVALNDEEALRSLLRQGRFIKERLGE